MSEANPREEAQQALKQADRAARRGDLAIAERWSKTAERLAAAAERLQAVDAEKAAQKQAEDYNLEECRAELIRRFALYTGACHDISAWEKERDEYYGKLRDALANKTEPPPPLRPAPFGDDAVVVLETIARDGSMPD